MSVRQLLEVEQFVVAHGCRLIVIGDTGDVPLYRQQGSSSRGSLSAQQTAFILGDR
jgi:hypothetical protein